MNREEIGVAASVQRERFNLPFGYDLAEMGRDGVDLCLDGLGGFGNVYLFGSLTHLQGGVDAERGVGIYPPTFSRVDSRTNCWRNPLRSRIGGDTWAR